MLHFRNFSISEISNAFSSLLHNKMIDIEVMVLKNDGMRHKCKNEQYDSQTSQNDSPRLKIRKKNLLYFIIQLFRVITSNIIDFPKNKNYLQREENTTRLHSCFLQSCFHFNLSFPKSFFSSFWN